MQTTEINFDTLPDITPQNTGDKALGRCEAFLEVELGGYPYYKIALIREDGTLGMVKINKKTYETSAFRNQQEAFKTSIEEACTMGLCVLFSRGKLPPNGKHPYWNIDRVEGRIDTTIPQTYSIAPQAPAQPQSTPQKEPSPVNTRTTTVAANDVDARFVTYMAMLDRVVQHLAKSPNASEMAVNVDANAVAFSILKGW